MKHEICRWNPSWQRTAYALWIAIAGIIACDPDSGSQTANGDIISTAEPTSSATGAVHSLAQPGSSQKTPINTSENTQENAPASVSPGSPALKREECPSDMALISGGVFKMGAPYAVSPEDDNYAHEVALRSFCMDLHQVTVSEYRTCVDKGSCAVPHADRFSCTWNQKGKLDHPINCVDYSQAKQACEAFGKRLPTEEEWEYAARGGSEGRTYAWGEDTPSSKLSCYNHQETCAVLAHPPGAFGLYGMTGNVWEWTSSPFVKYAGWVPVGEWHVYRGGSYSRRFPKWMKTWVRNRFRPNEFGAHLGFRCAADLQDTTCPTNSTPLDTDPTRCRLSGEKLPLAASATVRAGKWVDSAEPPVVSRTPSFDNDCARYKRSKPVAYEIHGSSFAQRQKTSANLGCSNRDVGSDFNSVCCPR